MLANVGFSKTNVGFSKTNVGNRTFVFTMDIQRKILRSCERQFYVKLTKNLTVALFGDAGKIKDDWTDGV